MKIKQYFKIFIGILIIWVILSLIFIIVKKLLDFSEEKFKEIIIAGIFQSTISGIILYFIFNELLARQANLTLFVEPSKIEDKQFKLNFYIKNIGDSPAKNTLLILSFPGLEIIEEFITSEKKHKRIDYLYGNTATLQINFDKPIYRYGKGNQQIAVLKFRLKDEGMKEAEIRYSVEAEGMNYLEDTYKIPVNIKI